TLVIKGCQVFPIETAYQRYSTSISKSLFAHVWIEWKGTFLCIVYTNTFLNFW
ncbi:hypothetical protein Q604_UNBc4C00191G0001, partial [human gut metagenome]